MCSKYSMQRIAALCVTLVLCVPFNALAQTDTASDTVLEEVQTVTKTSETALSDNQAVTLDEPTKAAVAKLQAYLKQTESMTADFSSVLLDPQGEPSGERSTGKLMIKRPGRFRWEYESPYPSLMLADGVNLWTYDEDLDEAIVRQLADYEAASPMLLLSGEVSIDESFNVLGSHVVEGAQWLVLAPLEKEADFVTVRLKLEDDKIQLMELVDKLDATSRIVFNDVAINPVVEDALFKFVLPEGANLVGQPAPLPTALPAATSSVAPESEKE